MATIKPFTASDLIVDNDSIRLNIPPDYTYYTYDQQSSTLINFEGRKMLLNAIQFLSFNKLSSIRDNICVIIGNGNVEYYDILAILFPHITFHAYEKDTEHLLPKSTNLTYYPVSEIINNKALYIDREFYFLSNYRSMDFNTLLWKVYAKYGITTFLDDGSPIGNPDSIALAQKETENLFTLSNIQDLDAQMEWVIALNPTYAFVKFSCVQPGANNTSILFPYFKGTVYYPIYSYDKSFESMLLLYKSADDTSYKISDWDNDEYNEWLYAHQNITRYNNYLNPLTGFNRYIDFPELLNDYDSTAEIFILKNFYKYYGQDDNDESAVLGLSKRITWMFNNQQHDNYVSLASMRNNDASTKVYYDPFKSTERLNKSMSLLIEDTPENINTATRAALEKFKPKNIKQAIDVAEHQVETTSPDIIPQKQAAKTPKSSETSSQKTGQKTSQKTDQKTSQKTSQKISQNTKTNKSVVIVPSKFQFEDERDQQPINTPQKNALALAETEGQNDSENDVDTASSNEEVEQDSENDVDTASDNEEVEQDSEKHESSDNEEAESDVPADNEEAENDVETESDVENDESSNEEEAIIKSSPEPSPKITNNKTSNSKASPKTTSSKTSPKTTSSKTSPKTNSSKTSPKDSATNELESLTVPMLKDILRNAGKKVGGTKQELIERIREFDLQ